VPGLQAKSAERLERVVVLVKGARDGEVTREILVRDELDVTLCANVDELCDEIGHGAAVVLLAEEVLTHDSVSRLGEVLIHQQPWSDLPIIVFSAAGRTVVRPLGETAKALGNVTFLDRPVQVRSMLAAVHAGIRARRRQYEGRRAIESRDLFLAMLGHELRNPLSAIGLAIATLDRDVPEMLRPKQYGIIERQSRHLGRLVDDLLDVARITHGKVVLKREVLNLTEVVRGTFDAFETRAREHQLSFDWRGLDARLAVLADRKYLEQVFSNVLSNAVKYTPRGGAVTVDVRAEGETAIVTVKDTGIGVAPAMLERIFEAFAQVDRSMDRADGGIGLGLALVRSIVHLHGGTVKARSEGLGKGTSFVVELPLAPKTLEVRTPSSALENLPASKRVVVIEDNADIRELLSDLLSLGGHRVSCAEDGPGGLEKILELSPDIAFVDLGIPGFDGFELARRARAFGSTAWLVALTGYGQPEDKRRASEAGFDEHLTKPVVESDVRRALLRSERTV
jgi:signal transduction histidine kinase/CheY-like chemotaxis protein